jgi:hypothetical protein
MQTQTDAPRPDLSLTQLAQLAAIVDYGAGIADDLLRAFVPIPEDASAWYGDLQALLDQELVERIAARDEYRYRATIAGVEYLRAHMHPFGRWAHMESRS